jgi:hydrogenase maturation protein HypF
MSQITYHIHITGIVQGVGFRPFIYNLALEIDLMGWVRNSANGVDIEVTGTKNKLDRFLHAIQTSAPPLAKIDSVESHQITTREFTDFKIFPSKNKSTDFIPISPDVAICSQCQSELFDPDDRRYRYPFINCTNCGPRFTIIKEIPYDRPKTTMAAFDMCPECLTEYENPRDRRFHAQPVACPKCGPHVWLEDQPGVVALKEEAAIRQVRQYLADGKILAIKGLGGFHLACDATNTQAVAKLRERKQRPSKPFALMAPNVDSIKNYVKVSPVAETLLSGPEAPIVLLPRINNDNNIAPGVAPRKVNLGFMLPYTPLHQLLLEPEEGAAEVLVMTSGNLSEEPILTENHAAREKLSHIADAFLMHNRPIYRRTDDSVYTLIEEKPYPIRRARGFAPNPIRIIHKVPSVLAVGPQMKNTFCLTRDRYAFVSHHIGEMDNWETYQDYLDSISHFESLFRIKPAAIAYDMHPNYRSTQYALERAASEKLPLFPIQHHHAHLASVMVENNLDSHQAIAGLIFDGTGYGVDGTIWGGEVLIGNCDDFTRMYHLKPVPLPGGEAAILKPARMALSTLWAHGLPWDEDLPPMNALSNQEQKILRQQLENNINTPSTTSMGRLFDAVSSLLGTRQSITYEAQAAIELEALADTTETGYYAWQIDDKEIIVKAMLEAILADIKKKVPGSIISARFHNTIAQISLNIALEIRRLYDIDNIALSGGVWQNLLLLKTTLKLLRQNGIHPIMHQQMPPNDGCVALGQAMIAAYRMMDNKE